nr:threonine-phosphate decarboxylase CobD [Caldalkalibacillus mannanilyticus]
MKWPSHGGQPQLIKQLFNRSVEEKLLDFSANLNPLGPPKWLEEEIVAILESSRFYPDPTYVKPRQAIARYEGIDMSQVLLTNGGAEAIFLVAKFFEGKKALILYPTFSEYEQACEHYHIQVEKRVIDSIAQDALPLDDMIESFNRIDLMFLCRPNNPTGTLIPEQDVLYLLEQARKKEVFIIVDEAFADFLPAHIHSLTSYLDRYDNLILLRSLTKMYTLPGLRIGYLMAHSSYVSEIGKNQIPWSVNSLAAGLVPRLLEDEGFLARTKDWLYTEWTALKQELDRLQFSYSPTSVNFYLLQDAQAVDQTEELYHHLLDCGILARHTHNFLGLEGKYLRLAIRSASENGQVIEALEKWRKRKC